jgi:hypothetical protein
MKNLMLIYQMHTFGKEIPDLLPQIDISPRRRGDTPERIFNIRKKRMYTFVPIQKN